MKSIALAATAAVLLSLGAVAVPTAAQARPLVDVQFAPSQARPLVDVQFAPSQVQPLVNVQYAPPPPPRFERVPPPRQGYVWAPGHYEWRGNRYVWMRGTWVQARPGYVYRAPQWRERDGRWEYRRGDWERGQMRRDRDHDGVPDRFDSRPNNPNRY